MAEHTPPPWQHVRETYGDFVETSRNSGVIIFRTSEHGRPSIPDANLIVAAPDLLYALEALMLEINPPTPGSIGETRINMVYSAAKAAIAKARGET